MPSSAALLTCACLLLAVDLCVPLAIKPSSGSGCSSWSEIGCFYDFRHGNELLSGSMTQTNVSSATACTAHCGEQGFSYAGVYQGNNCKCANSLGVPEPQKSQCCLSKCYDAPSESCGGICYALASESDPEKYTCSLNIWKCA